MTFFIASVRNLSRLSGVVAALLIVAGALVVCHLVIVRYVLNESAIWQHEFVTFALIASTFLGSPYLLLTNGHVNVDLLPLYLGGRLRFVLALLAAAISLAFCVLIAWTGFLWWEEDWTAGWRAETVWEPPLWTPYLAMPIGIGLLALQYIADILALLTGRAAPFGIQEKAGP